MPRLNHLALSKTKTNKKKQTLNSEPVVGDGAKREGVVL